jgi:hypothetical protein
VSSDPKTIRNKIKRTRSALEQKLDELKSRFSNSDPATQQRKVDMAKKKSSPKESTAKKKPSKGGTATVKKTAGKVATKAKEVLGDMLAGAAIGAVKGAAEAVEKKGTKPSKSKAK